MSHVATAPLLTVEDLEVEYGRARALAGVTLAVGAGDAVAVLGANGAGKSSLAAAVAGVVKPAAGRVRLDGRNVTGWAPHRVSRLGVAYLPEGRGIFPHLSVTENLRMMLRHAVPRRARDDAVDHAVELFPILGQRRRQQAGTLSGGEQQMLALARVLAAPPRILVADELSLGLAPLLIDLVFDSLEKARAAGVSVLLIEQYAERALAFAERAVILRRGEVAWDGPSADAREHMVAGYLGEALPPE
ncbi:MAG: ABC transporter ATP-binding protein [Acidimicrobiia bacterium]